MIDGILNILLLLFIFKRSASRQRLILNNIRSRSRCDPGVVKSLFGLNHPCSSLLVVIIISIIIRILLLLEISKSTAGSFIWPMV